MRLVFAGTPEFAAAALTALIAAGHEIALVLTQPDRPAGRGMQLTASPVKRVALAHDLPVFQPATLRDAASQEALRAARLEVMVVAAYGLILPQAVLDIPARGCLNIHASLLPRWRGAAPIQRAILAGDRETGITIMQMDAGLDTGAMLLAKPLTIGAEETAGSLHDRLAALGAAAIVEALGRLDNLAAQPQDENLATYAAKLDKAEARLDWRQPAEAIVRAVRAYNPQPGAYTSLRGEKLKIWSARALPGRGQPGVVLRADAGGPAVGCGAGLVVPEEVQKAGGRRVRASEWLAGAHLAPGERLGEDGSA